MLIKSDCSRVRFGVTQSMRRTLCMVQKEW